MYEIEIIPGILEKEWSKIEQKITAVSSFAKTIHIDLLDGEFTKEIAFLDPSPFKKYTSQFTFELHMMVKEPEGYLKPWAEVGFTRFLGHIEQMSDQESFVAEAEQFGEVGLAVDGPTAVGEITVPFFDLDCVLCMLNTAGKSGLQADTKNLTKVTTLRKETDSLFAIGVDQGINEQTIKEAYTAGANRFVTTSFLFSGNSPKEQYEKLRNALS